MVDKKNPFGVCGGGEGSIICGTNGTLERFVIYIAKFRWGSGPWAP